MKMQESDFRHALEIITRNNRITVSFNTPIADNYSQVYPLLTMRAATLSQFLISSRLIITSI